MKGFMKYLISESLIEPLVFRAWDAVCGQTFLQRAICQNAHDGAFCRTIIRRIVGEHSNCVDVGANRGEFLREMVECAPRGHHYAFEPLSDLADALQERYPGVRVWPAALGDQMGRAEFLYVVSNSPMSGFRRLSYYGRAEEIRKIAVAVYRLDDLLPPDFKVDLMKVDVEGAEYQVFQGGMRTLKTFKPGILFEFFRDWATTYGTTPEMIHRLLVGECGLQIWLPDEWLCGRPALTLPRLERIWRNRLRQNFFAYSAGNRTATGPDAGTAWGFRRRGPCATPTRNSLGHSGRVKLRGNGGEAPMTYADLSTLRDNATLRRPGR